MKKKRLITAALPYVNNWPHLGTLIGCVLSADVFHKYCQIADYEAIYICGTDEYGTTTETRAKQEGISPLELCDKYHKLHKEVYDWFEIDFTYFGRTTHPKQTEIVQDLFLKLYNNGYIIEDTLTQPYCNKCNMFLADRYIEGLCPHCNYDKAKGDQCEKCGKLLDPSELKTPRCVSCKNTPEFRKTEHLFLDLPKLQPELSDWLTKTAEKEGWSNNAIQVTKSWIENGLEKRCITRDLKWGIPVPLEKYKDKVFYVWFDAPIGYISMTATKYDNWEEWWKNPDNTELYQFIGKDNIPFHTVLFPSSLIGSQDNWTLLKTISSTEYLNYEDMKFSKSRGTGVFGDQVKETGIEADLFRYYLLRNRPEKNDTQFYWLDFMEKVNGEIIANYANLVNRVFQFINRFFAGEIPVVKDKKAFHSVLEIDEKKTKIIKLFEKVELKKALLETLDLCSAGNKFFQDNKPWELVKSDMAKCEDVIGNLANFVKDISILLFPYIPSAIKKVFNTLNLEHDQIKIKNFGQDISKTRINQPEVLFKKLEKKHIEELRDKFKGTQEDALSPAEVFSTYHLKVGKIIAIEKHPEADKLYIEKVDMGNNEIRQIVSGLVPYYSEKELLNKKVILAYNLKPAKLRGVKSEGMLLAAETKDRSIVEVIEVDNEIGQVVTIEGSKPNNKEITIEDFFQETIKIQNYQPVFMNQKLMINGKEIKVKKVQNGKVK